jgi:hypothetical protein
MATLPLVAHAVLARSGKGCQPALAADTCECSARGFRPTPRGIFPKCRPSAVCGGTQRAFISDNAAAAGEGNSATVLIVFDHTPGLVKTWYRINPWKSYVNSMRMIIRLVLSLRRVGTTLPITLWATGERHATFEARLVQLGVHIFTAFGPAYAIQRPAWINPHHYGSLQHLKVLALTRWRRLVMLDPDAVVLRNIDHLAHAPAPSVIFRFKCFPIWEINGGVMVLEPAAALHRRMQRAMNCSSWARAKGDCEGRLWAVPNDPSDQSVWRHFWEEVHELPVGFNAFKNANLSSDGWRHVSILHDVDVLRRNPLKWPEASVHAAYRNLSIAANAEVATLRESLGATAEAALAKRHAQLEGCTRQQEARSPCNEH